MNPSFNLFDVLALRCEFPILQQQQNGRPLAFLDSAASSQKPRRVIDCLEDYYKHTNANVHRGVYRLSEEATFAFERARGKLARFIGAASHREIVFTRNTTEAINLVARAWGDANLRPGDRVLLSMMEHHSNLVPWQMLAQRTIPSKCPCKALRFEADEEFFIEHRHADLQLPTDSDCRLRRQLEQPAPIQFELHKGFDRPPIFGA